jgi:hypothetical protein
VDCTVYYGVCWDYLFGSSQPGPADNQHFAQRKKEGPSLGCLFLDLNFSCIVLYLIVISRETVNYDIRAHSGHLQSKELTHGYHDGSSTACLFKLGPVCWLKCKVDIWCCPISHKGDGWSAQQLTEQHPWGGELIKRRMSSASIMWGGKAWISSSWSSLLIRLSNIFVLCPKGLAIYHLCHQRLSSGENQLCKRKWCLASCMQWAESCRKLLVVVLLN